MPTEATAPLLQGMSIPIHVFGGRAIDILDQQSRSRSLELVLLISNIAAAAGQKFTLQRVLRMFVKATI